VAAGDEEVKIEAILDTAGVKAGVADIESSLDSLKSTADDASNAVSEAGGAMAGAFGGAAMGEAMGPLLELINEIGERVAEMIDTKMSRLEQMRFDGLVHSLDEVIKKFAEMGEAFPKEAFFETNLAGEDIDSFIEKIFKAKEDAKQKTPWYDVLTRFTQWLGGNELPEVQAQQFLKGVGKEFKDFQAAERERKSEGFYDEKFGARQFRQDEDQRKAREKAEKEALREQEKNTRGILAEDEREMRGNIRDRDSAVRKFDSLQSQRDRMQEQFARQEEMRALQSPFEREKYGIEGLEDTYKRLSAGGLGDHNEDNKRHREQVHRSQDELRQRWHTEDLAKLDEAIAAIKEKTGGLR